MSTAQRPGGLPGSRRRSMSSQTRSPAARGGGGGMSSHADTIRQIARNWIGHDATAEHRETLLRGVDKSLNALLAENQQNAHKVAAYDAARATVKIEGNTRAFYVLRAERAEAENQRLRELLRDVLPHLEGGHDEARIWAQNVREALRLAAVVEE